MVLDEILKWYKIVRKNVIIKNFMYIYCKVGYSNRNENDFCILI